MGNRLTLRSTIGLTRLPLLREADFARTKLGGERVE